MLQPGKMTEIMEEISKARVGVVDRRSRKRSSSAGSEKMERVGDT
jgi:hypothetical protein